MNPETSSRISRTQDLHDIEESDNNGKIKEQTVIPLLEERLIVNLTQEKRGEIVVRKEVETRLIKVEVPVRHEKLIVEQTLPEYQKIAEVDIAAPSSKLEAIQNGSASGESLTSNPSLEEPSLFESKNFDLHTGVRGKFRSIQDAHIFLDLVFADFSPRPDSVYIEIAIKTP
ncbi:MAG TPA: DUF2382 domain-containing protein [Stenomitos sp.]